MCNVLFIDLFLEMSQKFLTKNKRLKEKSLRVVFLLQVFAIMIVVCIVYQYPREGSAIMKNCRAFIIMFLFIFFANPAFAGDLDIQHYFDEGNTYFNEGQYKKAIESYSRLIAIYPDFIQGYYNRGLAYYKAGKYDEAVADYSRVISSPADANAELYNNRAIAYLKKGDYENAVKDYSTVISINPRLPDAYHNRGIAYANNGKYDEAIEDYNRVISMKPKDLNVYLSRGVAYTKKAVADFRRACDAGSELACDNLKQLSR
jgi:tetratricopeptide (TPR) repeat protein